MNINISLNDASSLNSAISQLENYAARFKDMCFEVCEQLAKIGKDVLNATYSAAAYAGTNDIQVSSEPIEGGYRLSANGSVLGFIEFGTGAGYPLGEYAGQVGAPAHGTYGKGKGANPPWKYIGEGGNAGEFIASTPRGTLYRTDGNPPANAFPAAVEAMRANFSSIVQGVFG